MPATRPTAVNPVPSTPLPPAARDHVAQLLAEDRDATVRRLDQLAADFDELVSATVDSNDDDEHDPEGSTLAFERSQVDALVRQARHHLDEVDAAAARLVDGSYGRCEACGRPVPADRLEARPVARTCIGCTQP
jgi:DnaK suppressor protein